MYSHPHQCHEEGDHYSTTCPVFCMVNVMTLSYDPICDVNFLTGTTHLGKLEMQKNQVVRGAMKRWKRERSKMAVESGPNGADLQP